MALSTTTLLGLQSTTTIVYELLGMPPFCTILTIYIDVVNILFILGLMLMVLGGALMAGSQLFPGNMKGTIMGYGIGILVGGIMAVLIGILSPYLVSVLTGLSANQITAAFIKNFIC